MNENETEVIDSTIDTEITENTDEQADLSDDTQQEDVEALKKQINTLNAQKEHWKKKAEKGDDAPKKPTSSSKEVSLSTRDTIALIEAKVSTEDFDEVVDFANYRKISVAEAIKSPTLKAILSEKSEERQTAAATQTRSPRVSPKVTDEQIIDKARKGQFPETDEEIARLAAAQHREFIAKRKK